MSENKVIVVFTAKSAERILREGGTSSWHLNRKNARQCEFAVCARNANADWVEGQEEHHAAFLVGKIKDVVTARDNEERFLIQFSEYALVNIPDVWEGDRNPVRYAADLESLGIKLSSLQWQAMPTKTNTKTALQAHDGGKPLTLAEAKKGLALTFGVAPEAIEIIIRV